MLLGALLGAFVLVVMTALYFGGARWGSASRILTESLERSRIDIFPAFYEGRSLEGLPLPVQRYLHAVLAEGQPVVTAANVWHRGTFNVSGDHQRWKPFTSHQRILTRRPGFCWDARIRMCPGLTAHVHDAYVAGEGTLRVAMLGLLKMVDLQGEPELAEAELMRFLAEAAWYPTVLLPGQNIEWEAVGAASAKATLRDGEIAAALMFHFDETGFIRLVRAESRNRLIGGKPKPTPWEGRWWNYALRGGMLVPLEGEAAWVLPAGRRPYWRGRMTHVDYEFSG